jgi:hypothetical protein
MPKPAKSDSVKSRLQVVLCPMVATNLERHAKELDRSQAWIAGWAISNTLRDRGAFGEWMIKRMKSAAKNQQWSEVRPEGGETRVQLRVEQSLASELDVVATALNQSPLKLAGLMIEFAMDEYAPSLSTLKTSFGKMVRSWVQGEDESVKYDEVDEATAKTSEAASGEVSA